MSQKQFKTRENATEPEVMEAEALNPKHYLGNLCKRGHEYLSTGMSLRWLSSKCCIKCNRIKRKKYRDSPKRRAAQKKYGASLEGKAACKKYRVSSKGKAVTKKYRDSPKAKAFIKKYHKNHVASLCDGYIKAVLRTYHKIPIKNITSEMIELKREIMLINRLIKEVGNGINR